MTESLVTVYFSVCCCTTVSERLRSCRGPSRLAHHGDLRHRSEASLRNYIGRPSSEKIRACSDILSDELRGKPHQSLQPSFRALSSRATLHVSGEFGWKSLFSTCHVKKLACFISHTSAEVHWTFQFQILYLRLKTFRQKCQIWPSEPFKFVNYSRMWTLMAWHFWQL